MIEVCFFWVIHMTLSQWPLLWISKRYLDLRMLDAKGEKKSKNIIPNGGDFNGDENPWDPNPKKNHH